VTSGFVSRTEASSPSVRHPFGKWTTWRRARASAKESTDAVKRVRRTIAGQRDGGKSKERDKDPHRDRYSCGLHAGCLPPSPSRGIPAKSREKTRGRYARRGARYEVQGRTGGAEKRTARKWKIAIGRSGDATEVRARPFVLMKAAEWKLRLRSTLVIAIIAPLISPLDVITFLINRGARV